MVGAAVVGAVVGPAAPTLAGTVLGVPAPKLGPPDPPGAAPSTALHVGAPPALSLFATLPPACSRYSALFTSDLLVFKNEASDFAVWPEPVRERATKILRSSTPAIGGGAPGAVPFGSPT